MAKIIKMKDLIKEELYNSQGETYTFGKGDIVKDINPDCPHHGAEGEVKKVGKGTITFIVTNNGSSYKEGDELEKTVDQMVKLKEGKLNEYSYGLKTSQLVGTKKSTFFGAIYNMKEEMKEGKFDPKNPTVHIHGLGVHSLKGLEKTIARELKETASRGAEFAAVQLYRKHSTTEAKIKAANDVYKQMETSQYKRAVTIYKKKR